MKPIDLQEKLRLISDMGHLKAIHPRLNIWFRHVINPPDISGFVYEQDKHVFHKMHCSCRVIGCDSLANFDYHIEGIGSYCNWHLLTLDPNLWVRNGEFSYEKHIPLSWR